MTRKKDGDDTWFRLVQWTKGPKVSERLAAQLMISEGFKSVDPSHPLGGKDGLKDLIAWKNNIQMVCAVYFPRKKKRFSEIESKFSKDLEGVLANNVSGLVFFTNQELTLNDRKKLKEVGQPHTVEIYHLERITSLLNSPENYGVRYEYLDIGLSKEELISFFTHMEKRWLQFENKIELVTAISMKSLKEADNIKSGKDWSLKSRAKKEIENEIVKLKDLIWLERHKVLKSKVKNNETVIENSIWKGALRAENNLSNKYDREELGPYSDYEWGKLNGKLSALNWVFGHQWDKLDT